MTTKNIKLLEWYYNSGVTDVTSNTARSYLKEKNKPSCLSVQNDILSSAINSQSASARELAERCSSLSELKNTVQNFCTIDKFKVHFKVRPNFRTAT